MLLLDRVLNLVRHLQRSEQGDLLKSCVRFCYTSDYVYASREVEVSKPRVADIFAMATGNVAVWVIWS
jgi:hypothetical protein